MDDIFSVANKIFCYIAVRYPFFFFFWFQKSNRLNSHILLEISPGLCPIVEAKFKTDRDIDRDLWFSQPDFVDVGCFVV